VRCSSTFHWSGASTPAVHGLAPCAMDAIDHNSSITCRYLPGFYTGTKSHCFVTEPHGCEQLAQSPVRSVSVQWNLAGDRSRDLVIARHMTPFAVCLFPVARDMLFVQSSETLRSRTSSRAVTPSTASLTRTTSLSIAKKLFNAPLSVLPATWQR